MLLFGINILLFGIGVNLLFGIDVNLLFGIDVNLLFGNALFFFM
jgi:hypothetical protein